MIKLTVVTLLTFSFSIAYSQQDFFLFKKKDKTIAYFKKYSYIAFQLNNRQWYTGNIEKVQNDSFYINPYILHLTMFGIDTVHYGLMKIALTDVYAMPKKGVQFGYSNEMAHITNNGGHVHWKWIKDGSVFRAAGGGYIILNVINGIIKNNFSFSKAGLIIATSLLLAGEVLHLTYKSSLKLGKKYYLQSINIGHKSM